MEFEKINVELDNLFYRIHVIKKLLDIIIIDVRNKLKNEEQAKEEIKEILNEIVCDINNVIYELTEK